MTSGGLTVDDLAMNAKGLIVSRRKQAAVVDVHRARVKPVNAQSLIDSLMPCRAPSNEPSAQDLINSLTR